MDGMGVLLPMGHPLQTAVGVAMYQDLFTLSGWKVRGATQGQLSAHGVYNYHASHVGCCGESWLVKDSSASCVQCDTPVPDEIQALVLMLVDGVVQGSVDEVARGNL